MYRSITQPRHRSAAQQNSQSKPYIKQSTAQDYPTSLASRIDLKNNKIKPSTINTNRNHPHFHKHKQSLSVSLALFVWIGVCDTGSSSSRAFSIPSLNSFQLRIFMAFTRLVLANSCSECNEILGFRIVLSFWGFENSTIPKVSMLLLDFSPFR